MIPALKFTEKNWDELAQNWSAWWAGELARPLVMIENPVRGRSPEELTQDFLLHKPIDQVLDYYESRLEKTTLFGDAWPKWWPFYGAGVVAAFLGAELICTPEEDTIWFEPGQPFDSYAIEALYNPQNIWWQRICELTQAAVERWQGQVSIGITDLGGNLDILASLRTTQMLLLDLYDLPDEVAAAVQQIDQIWLKFYRELYALANKFSRGSTPWAPIWSPGKGYMLQSDFSAMISPGMFERFVLPSMTTLCQELDHPFYHMDGKGQLPHLDMLLSIEKLRGIQWIPGDGQPPPEEWLPVLQRIRNGGKLCQLFVSAKGARTIVRNLGGKGFAFYINEPLDSEEVEAFLDEINS
jgi:5-methyltetrahydrofolate--homocysteine methyltransferase